MVAKSIRVALLARPGPARDRLRAAIEEAGASCVLDADPTQLDAAGLAGAAPQLVLVALDPQTDDVLERFDGVLFDPAVDVVYEEADLAAGREGWEVARWQRHLVAKLQRHRNVLPPGQEPEDDPPSRSEPGPVQSGFDQVGFDPTGSGQAEFEQTEFEQVEFEQAGPVAAVEDAGPATEAAGSPFDPVMAEDGAGDALDGLQLDAGTGMPPEVSEDSETKGRFERDLQMLESRISGLQLVQDEPPATGAAGAIIVLAGIGGPDAVRQLLGALPNTLPRPVLVRQQLDGARYDKLVAQMQRASTLPVVLAVHGEPLTAGMVHVVPPDLGVEGGTGSARFQAGAELLGVLPPGDSAIVLLSGSDPALVDGLMKQRLAGALVVGQVADGCYDPAASQAFASRGGETDTPLELAARITARWPAEGEPA